MLTVEEIKRNYRQLDDWKIKELSLSPKSLRKDIIPILIEEIKRRNLGDELIILINNETYTFEGLEKKNLIQKIIQSKCSSCSVNSNLNGYRFTTIFSALITITDKTEHLIICDICARNKRLDSMLKTFFFGWWSKRGFLATPFALASDTIKIFRRESESKKVIDEFIKSNTGILRKSLEENNLNDILAASNNLKKHK